MGRARRRATRGHDAFVLNADDPLIADLGRDREGRPRERIAYFGVEDRSHALARARARLRRQALPPLRADVQLRAPPTSATSGTTTARTAATAGPAPAVAADARRAARHVAARSVSIATPAGALELSLPLPGLYNVYNALAATACCLELGHRARARSSAGSSPSAAAFGRAERIDDRRPRARDPADQEPAGANEVFRTLRAGRRAGRLDLWITLNDGIADGRDISWIWDADFELLAGVARRVICSGTRAEELALRLKYAGVDGARVEIAPGARGRARPLAGRRRRAAAVRAPDLHRAARAARAARGPRPRAALLGMSARRTTEPEIAPIVWHDLECGSYHADLAALAGARWRAAPRAGTCSVLDLGCGTGRVASTSAAGGPSRDRPRPRSALAGGARRRAPAQDVARRGGGRRRPRLRPRPAVRPGAGRRCSCSSCSRTADERRRSALRASRAHLRARRPVRGGAARPRRASRPTTDYLAAAARHARDRRLGLVEPGRSRSGCSTAARRSRSTVAAGRSRRAARSPRARTSVRLELVSPDELEDELRAAGIEPIERRPIPPTDGPRRQRRRDRGGARWLSASCGCCGCTPTT